MKIILSLISLALLSLTNRSLVSAQQRPTSASTTQNQATPIKVVSTITHYSDSLTAATMSDTAYLHNLSGRYRISDSATEVVTIRVSKANTLRIDLPGQGEHTLIPIIPIQFKVEDLPQVTILVFLDRYGRSRAINITDERAPSGSRAHLQAANKLGLFKD